MTAPKPNVAESDSCAMLPTLATIIIASAGQTIVPTETPEAAGTAGTASRGFVSCHLWPDFVGGCGGKR